MMHILDIRITLPFLCSKRAQATDTTSQGTTFNLDAISGLDRNFAGTLSLDKSETPSGVCLEWVSVAVSYSDFIGNITLDLLGVYMMRDYDGGTIICYHPPPKQGFTSSATHNHSWIQRIGQDNHWKNIFRLYDEPTFALLPILWYVVYAWADALKTLYIHLNTLVSIAP